MTLKKQIFDNQLKNRIEKRKQEEEFKLSNERFRLEQEMWKDLDVKKK